MPCKKCKDENYKYGNTGECKYATKESCESANPKKYSKMNPTPLGKKTYEEYEKELKEFNLSKVERVELATIPELIKEGKNAKKLINNAKKELQNLKSQARLTADAFDNFMNGPYFEITQAMPKIRTAAKELGVDIPKELEAANDMVIEARGEFKNGRSSKWFKEINSL
jgi:hypothetical protein|tara:strand:- start:130 stop:636 length:507 start_codon:yes stop_codon:yes gene_type:complete